MAAAVFSPGFPKHWGGVYGGGGRSPSRKKEREIKRERERRERESSVDAWGLYRVATCFELWLPRGAVMRPGLCVI